MNKQSLVSMVAFAFTLGLLGSCAVQDTTTQDTTTQDITAQDTTDNAAASGGDVTATTCDIFDTYCGPDRPCLRGFFCIFNPPECGTDVSGTFPDCHASDACLPYCEPDNLTSPLP
jgi:hypothetical protein